VGSKKQTSITLNGKRYDALTGQLADDHGSIQPAPVMDVVAPRGSHATQVAVPTPAPTAAPEPPTANPSGPKVMDVARSTVHLKPRQPQRANTLVRSAVSKPQPGLRSRTKVSAPTQALSVPQNSLAPKWSITQVNPTRQSRAGQIPKSEAISRFSSSVESPQAVAAVKIEKPQQINTAAETQPQRSQALFERAIAAADSHTLTQVDQKKLSKRANKQAKRASRAAKRPVHHHLVSVVAASLAVLVIGGFVGLQNKDTLTLRFANAQAGFKASLPTYQPEGYGVGSFTYGAGNVGTTFHDDGNGRDYTLNQQTTKWDSQDLLDTYVAPNYPSYQALQSGSQVIYVYGKNDASWVKHGIWYQLRSDGNLSTTQVLNIAASV
jgi:hypothetical protein